MISVENIYTGDFFMNKSTKKLVICALFAAITAVLAQIILPIGPVPINLAHIGIFMAAESCPNIDWVSLVNRCQNLHFMRVTDIDTFGNGDVLIDIKRRGIGGVDGYGNNVAGKCYLTGVYQLTKELSESIYNELKAY